MALFAFSRKYSLKSTKSLSDLFEKGQRIKNQLFTLVYIENKERSEPLIKIAFSVPKRKVKKAVDRNRVKRKMKEVYRLHQPIFLENLAGMNSAFDVMLIYHGNKEDSYPDIEHKIILLLNRFSERLCPENSTKNQ